MLDVDVTHHTLSFGDQTLDVCTLADDQQCPDDPVAAEVIGISTAQWPIFGVLWPGGLALAEHAATIPLEGRRILEVGCGIGLTSLVLAARGADVTATDRHPAVGAFLARNAERNGLDPIRFVRTSWGDDDDPLGRFDLILGAELLYDRDAAAELPDFLDAHAEDTCEVVLTDPGRGGHRGRVTRAMEAKGYEAEVIRPPESPHHEWSARMQILTYRRDRR